MKYFRFTWQYVLWEITWANLMMLLQSIPDYTPPTDDKQAVPDDIPDDAPDGLEAAAKALGL